MTIYSFSPLGHKGTLVLVETKFRKESSPFDIVGLSDGDIGAARSRVRCAIKNYGIQEDGFMVHLEPCDLLKQGTFFDLAMAVSIANYSGKFNFTDKSVLILGELGLQGQVYPVKGVQEAVKVAIEKGIELAIIPMANIEDDLGIKAIGVSNISQALDKLQASN